MKLLCAFLFVLSTSLLPGQYGETIVSGRPGQSIGAATVGRGVYQVQTGINLDWSQSGSGHLFDLTEVTDLRVGITERLELSALIAGASDELEQIGGSRRDRGISDTQVGGRYLLFPNRGIRPALALRGHVLLTAQDEDFRRENTGGNLILAAEWTLTDLLGLAVNLSRTWTGNDEQTTDYVTTLGFSLSDRWSSFLEVYGTLSGEATSNYDGGFAYLATDDLAFDLSVGWDGDYGVKSYFLDAGISFRFVKRRPGRALPSGE
ncbi:transporter [Lewinella sp. IMCC34191]|uniref:transporter n=1 Tax=Lewinella sp. IMCC34191 TaxID=2259172 RepID=UPI000E23FFDD|nr:transporter [Lewinella sp. IMCC34191]